MKSDLTPGRIVWVAMPDSQGGNPKARPAVVVSEEHEHADGFVRLAALTTLTGRARFVETVLVPADPAMRRLTKLKRECEVVCTWVLRVPIEEVNATKADFQPT